MTDTAPYSPSPHSLQHRANLAQLIRPLKRVRPRVPFWELAAHRIPTLWTLYRGLLRNAPGDNIRWRMRMFFEQNQCLTSPARTKEKLLLAHKCLGAFEAAANGDERMQAVLRRYDSMIASKCAKERMKSSLIEEFAWQTRLLTRPILTGSYVRPNLHNGPLPRFHKDPEHIRMMIHKRRVAHNRRGEKYAVLQELKEDLKNEGVVWQRLGVDDDISGYIQSISDHQAYIRSSFNRTFRRPQTPYPQKLLDQIKDARRDKIINKTHEKRRAASGERFAYTEKLMRKRPPAHVWERMSETRKKMEIVSRSVSKVGYVGKVKRMLGMKVKGPGWDCEVGRDEDREMLDEREKEVEKINEERRQRLEMETKL